MCAEAPDDLEPCASCPAERIDAEVKCTRAGELLRAVLDIDFSRQAGIQLAGDDLTAEEFHVLKMIFAERNRFEIERREEEARERAREQRRQHPHA
jgi:hypothetical protein